MRPNSSVTSDLVDHKKINGTGYCEKGALANAGFASKAASRKVEAITRHCMP
jgi:hypothetical protein